MSKLENYYGKFCEDKRLLSRHGQVEYTTSMKYIHKYLKSEDRILDIGAGTGRYSVALSNEGYQVDAIELVKYNLGVLKAKKSNVKAYQGTALDLSRYQDNTFDVTLLFGPMYHLFSYEDKLKALSEAKRVTKKDGIIFVAYVMNEYSVLVHGFRDGHIKESLEAKKLDETFQTQTNIDDLYSYIRLDTINQLNKDVGLERIQIIAADGPSDYMRPILNKMDDETFDIVLSMNGFHAFPDKIKAFQETWRVLKPGGDFIACFYIKGKSKRTDWLVKNVLSKKGWFTPPFQTEEELRDILEKFYQIIDIHVDGSMVYFHCRKR